ncbi:copia protein [Tanacetum coccineum]
MNRGFLDSGGRNNNHRKKTNTDAGTGSFMESDRTLNDADPLKEVVSPSVIDEPVAMELLRLETPLIDVVVPMESIQAISERFVNTAYGFFLGKRVAYPVVSNYVKNTWGKFGLVKSMLNSSTGLFSFQFSSMDGLNSMLENGPWFIRNHPLILRKWNPNIDLLKEDVGNVRSSYARAMIELRSDVELKDTIVEECPKNIGLGVAKNLKKPSQLLEPTARPSGNKKKGVAHTNEVSNSNLFDVLNSVDNDVELVDEAGNPLKKVECPGDYDSEDEVASADNDMARSLASNG